MCRPKDQGGLGIAVLQTKNKCLLSKWLHKLLNEEGVWQELITNKYLHSKTLSQVSVRAPLWREEQQEASAAAASTQQEASVPGGGGLGRDGRGGRRRSSWPPRRCSTGLRAAPDGEERQEWAARGGNGMAADDVGDGVFLPQLCQ